jgi:hypothetical protein
MSHLSYEGQTKVDYCLECCEKHGATGKVLMREAIQRCDANGCNTEGVKEKIKGVVEELMGIENDTTTTTNNERVDAINKVARALWKDIYSSGAEIGGASKEDLKSFQDRLAMLTDLVYKTRELEGDCPTCKVKKLEEEEQEPQEKPLDLSEYGKTASEKRRQLMEEIRSELGQ